MVKIRLRRMGAKKAPYYRVVVADSRYPRDGRFIEELGTYNPCVSPAEIKIDTDRALEWIKTGAQPTETVRALAAKGARFSFMSDISPIHLDQVFKYCEFVHLVTGGIYSFEAGAFKLQGSAMFDAFERRYGRPLVFFDDRAEIIEHARGLGWNAVRFESPEQVLRDASALLDNL